ncbi:MAG: site-specific integrase [Saprospiraceae bacterium]|jgi:site-specific recombinase XerD|nr:site-specific integrase [Saprospiraceae bacterium]
MKKLDFLKVSFIVRKDRMQNGLGPVYLQLFLDSKRVRISTDQLVNMKDWDEKLGRLKGNSAMSNSLNEYLEKIKLDTLRIYNDYKLKETDITVDMLKDRLTKKEIDQRKKLLEVCDIFNSNAEKLIGIEIGKITWGRYLAFRKRIADFLKLKYSMDDIYLSHLKYSFMVEYEFYIKTEVKIQQNTMVKYLKYVNRVVEFAVNNEWMERNIFQNYKCPVKEAKREYLTQAELERIMTKEITIERLSEVRDVFVFCCHTGYAYKDAAMLTNEHIGTGINGRQWIYTSRQKNDNVANVPLLDIALEIIDKYKDHPKCVKENKLLPMKSNQKLNTYLKELADICDIKKPLTMHIARHTFATTVLLANGVSMEATSKMLGHSSIKTTQIYGKIVESRVADEMEMLSKKIGKKAAEDQKKAK